MVSEGEWSRRRFHFIGVGGQGMSGLAIVCTSLGAQVTGSDRAQPPLLERLRAAGVRVVIGHAPENVPDGVEVVYSSAVKADNVERVRGRELGLPEIRRGELLAQVSRLRRSIAIAGSHGKTTTSAMIAHTLRHSPVTTGYVIGAELRDGSPNARWEQGDWLVLESDESDGTFLALEPEIGVVTNVEAEHLKEYGSMDRLRQAFESFMANSRSIVIADRPDLRVLAGDREVTTFDSQDVVTSPEGVRFRWRGRSVRLQVPGEHNARNAAAALEVCRLVGVEPSQAVPAIETFPGARRRLEYLGETSSGTRIYEDYASHPNTIRTTLAALRTIHVGRIVAVFEPILYTRTRALAEPLGQALAEGADAVAVLDVYPASEAGHALPGVSGRLVADAARRHARDLPVFWTPTRDDAEAHLESILAPHDACVFLGVGPEPQRIARALRVPG